MPRRLSALTATARPAVADFDGGHEQQVDDLNNLLGDGHRNCPPQSPIGEALRVGNVNRRPVGELKPEGAKGTGLVNLANLFDGYCSTPGDLAANFTRSLARDRLTRIASAPRML